MGSRTDKLLRNLAPRDLVGAEVGPLDRPLVRKDEGVVYYIDHCDTPALKARWSKDPNVDTSVLQVDCVWGKMSLREALLAALPRAEEWQGLDYVIASHVIEHVPDLISWFREVHEVLKPGGTLRLAVPDRRYTFDYLRRTSTFAEVADAYIRKRRAPSGSRVLDFTLNMAHVDCAAAWNGTIDERTLVHAYTQQQAFLLARDAEERGVYHDVHCWVFTPWSFVDLMAQMAHAGLFAFTCDWLLPPERNTFEFLASLEPATTQAEAEGSWKRIQTDLQQLSSE
jgi:SAM-dependent methyltransferase